MLQHVSKGVTLVAKKEVSTRSVMLWDNWCAGVFSEKGLRELVWCSLRSHDSPEQAGVGHSALSLTVVNVGRAPAAQAPAAVAPGDSRQMFSSVRALVDRDLSASRSPVGTRSAGPKLLGGPRTLPCWLCLGAAKPSRPGNRGLGWGLGADLGEVELLWGVYRGHRGAQVHNYRAP